MPTPHYTPSRQGNGDAPTWTGAEPSTQLPCRGRGYPDGLTNVSKGTVGGKVSRAGRPRGFWRGDGLHPGRGHSRSA